MEDAVKRGSQNVGIQENAAQLNSVSWGCKSCIFMGHCRVIYKVEPFDPATLYGATEMREGTLI